MVFQHFVNMIGETNEERAEIPPSEQDNAEETFLSELAKHVNRSGNLPNNPQQKSDNLGRVAGFGIGIGSLYLQEALGYPFIVFRRQCQVNHGGMKYHVLPFSLFHVMQRMYHRQNVGVFWKGWGSNCIVKGVSIITELVACELLSVPRKKQTIGMKETTSFQTDIINETVKGICALIILPLQSTCIIDSVQSLSLDQSRYMFTFFKDAFHRLVGWYVSRGHGRLLPLHQLILPSVVYGLTNYAVKGLINRILVRSNTSRYKIDDKIDEKNMKKIYYAELMSNLLSSLITDILTYPLETVVLRLHLQGTRTIIDDTDKGIGVVPLCTNYDDMFDCFDTVVREEGASGLYKGFGALIIQYTLQFIIVKLAKPLYCN